MNQNHVAGLHTGRQRPSWQGCLSVPSPSIVTVAVVIATAPETLKLNAAATAANLIGMVLPNA